MAGDKARLAFVLGGENFTRWNSSTGQKQVEPIDSASVDKAIAEITSQTKEHGKTLSVLSWAGSKNGDEFSMNNFPIRDKKRAEGSFNFRSELDKELQQQGLKPEDAEVIINNDGDLNLMDSVLNSKLKQGQRAVGVLLGSGLSLSDGRNYQGDGKFERITSYDAAKMPELEKYRVLEGPERQYSDNDSAGTAAAYITAGHEGEQKLGAKATAVNLAQLAEDKSKSKEFKEAIKLLYGDSGFFKKIWNFISFAGIRQRKSARNSEVMKLFKEHQTITNDRLLEAAKKGDRLSLQILIFTAKRVVEFMQDYLEQNKDDPEPEKIFFYGKFANDLFNAESGPLTKIRKHLEKEMGRTTKAKIEVTNAEMDGAMDLAQRLE